MSQPSSSRSPFRDGFAVLWNEPVLVAAELTWRSCFGLSALALAIISAAMFLDSIKISPSDELLLSTLQPQLLHGVVRHIFRGTLTRFVWEQAAVVIGLMSLWSLAATVGRAATLRRLVALFSADEEPETITWQFGPVFILQLLRAMWSLIALAAMIVSLLLGIIMSAYHRPALAGLFLLFGIGMAWGFGLVLNWFFGLAPLFCMRNNAKPPEALVQATDFCSRQAGRLFGLGLGFLTLRLSWAGALFLVLLSPLKLSGQLGARWVALIMAIIALIYFAGADILCLARLGAYASLAEDDAHPVQTVEETTPVEPSPPSETAPIVGLS